MANFKCLGHLIGFVLVSSLLCDKFLVNAQSTEVDPSKPRSCYSCSGINCYRTSASNVTEQCTDVLDICVTIFEGFGVIERGCLLDVGEETRSKCEGNDNHECHKCFGQLCNNLGREDFMCYECSGSACQSLTDTATEVRCPVPTSPNSYCYVENKSDGTVERGCSISVAHQRSCFESKTCALCMPGDKAGCNNFKIVSGPITSGAASRMAAVGFSILLMTFVNVML